MDGFEAARIVFSRIQRVVEPKSASKIIGLLLLKDHGEQEMIRLACCPESHLHSVILALKSDLALSSPTRLSSSPFLNSSLASRLGIPSPVSVPFSDSDGTHGFSPSSVPVSSTGVYQFSPPHESGGDENLIDESQMQAHLSFLNDDFPNDADQGHLLHNPNPAANNHDFSADADLPQRRSYSVNDVSFNPELESDSVGAAWKQCMYFTRGFCKNGPSCRFLHAVDPDGLNHLDSPRKVEIMKQRSQLLRSMSSNPYHLRLLGAFSFMPASPPASPYLADKYINFLMQNQHIDSPRAASETFIDDDLLNLAQTGYERSHLPMNGGPDMMNPGSRQIYLTFPADSSFREEDVSSYFGIYGPVQDVRIPYQQKRMFGFVTFVYPETVKIILAKGNPHFVCDARVLVKPYKEKGKVLDRYRNLQPLHRGDYLMCNSPTDIGLRDPFDSQTIGPGMLNNQDIIWRRNSEEHADLQQALELQSHRLMGMRLQDANRQHHQRALSLGGLAIPSHVHVGGYLNGSYASSSYSSSPESNDGNCYSPQNGTLPNLDSNMNLLNQLSVDACKEGMQTHKISNFGINGNDMSLPAKFGDSQESVNPEHYLPESPFTSPGKVRDHSTVQTDSGNEADRDINTCGTYTNSTMSPLYPAATTLQMAKSCYFQLPGLSSTHGAIKM